MNMIPLKRKLQAALAIAVLLMPQLSKADLGGNDSSAVPNPEQAAAEYQAPDWRLVWSDEFDHTGLPNPLKWLPEYGYVRNKEVQFYTRDRQKNACVKGGNLIITAVKEPWQGAFYTSASLTTENRFSFTYGKVEIRAKIPAGRGTWPAIWLLGDKKKAPWPRCGEIDMMEFVGCQPDSLHFTVHTATSNHLAMTQRGTHVHLAGACADFHRYGLVWTPDRLVWYLDDKPVFSFANTGKGPAEWPFDSPQYLIVNLAIGGSWGGQRGIDDTIFPAEFLIDYVRVWQMPKTKVPNTGFKLH